MTMTNVHDTARDAMCNALVDLIDAGGTGTMRFYTTGKALLLATLTFSATAFGDSATGTAAAAAITSALAGNDGTVRVVDVVSGGGTVLWDGTCGTAGADVNFNTDIWTTGDNIAVTSMTVTIPASGA